MTRYRCEGGKGCVKPCEIDDFTEGVEPNTIGYCRYTGESKTWTLIRRLSGIDILKIMANQQGKI